MGRIALITDSTAGFDSAMAGRYGIGIVPLTVHFGERTYADGVDLTADEFYRMLEQPGPLPTTSQPSPAVFRDAFAAALREPGVEGVLCVTLSRRLSGTWQAAEQARSMLLEQDAGASVTVVDSGTASAAQALALLAVERRLRAASENGLSCSAEEAAGWLRSECAAMRVYACLGTLDYLVRGGRIGRAQGLLGEALGVKPLIAVREGEVVPAGKVRSRRRALETVAGIFLEEADRGHPIGVVHAGAPEDATWLEQRIRESVESEEAERLMVLQFGLTPVIGTHVGPGVVGIAFRAKAGSRR